MPPRVDTLFRFPGPTGQPAHCRLRIHAGSQPDGSPIEVPVVIASELACHPGQTITHAVDLLAAAVLRAFLPDRIGQAPAVRWVEHYGPAAHCRGRVDELTEVRFSSWTPHLVEVAGQETWSLGVPSFHPIDRATLEDWIGEPFAAGALQEGTP
jgi:hypothetical protein